MRERAPRLVEAELTPEQLAVYLGITSGPRASGQQVFALKDENGALNGPFGLMLHVPALGSVLQELGAAIRYRTRMSNRVREIAILQVAAATQSDFERYAHERLGRAAGLSDVELDALRTGRFCSGDSKEQTVYLLCERLLAGEDIDALAFQETRRVLNDEEILEVTILVGYYRTLAQMMAVFNVKAPAEEPVPAPSPGAHPRMKGLRK